MADINVEKVLKKLTLTEKVDLLAGEPPRYKSSFYLLCSHIS
jgi:hypothetical protein